MRFLTRFAARLLAAVAVIAVIVGPVLAVAYAAGNPIPADFFDRVTDRTVDDRTIVKILSIGFYVCWAWFCGPALHQLLTVGRRPVRPATHTSRQAAGTPAAPTAVASSRGLLARLARFAVSGAVFAATVAGPSSSSVAGHAAPAATAEVIVRSPDAPAVTVAPATVVDDVTTVTAAHRDTPYALARRHFPPEQVDDARNKIVELNAGRPLPDGSPYRSGGFPAGWEVLIPAPPPPPAAAEATPGESVDSDDTDVAGHMTSAAAGDTADGRKAAHVVQPEECYWSIAEDHLESRLDRDPEGAEVLAYTLRLIDANAPRLGYDDQRMLHPGDNVQLVTPDRLTPQAPVTGGDHVVTTGESYWSISEDQLGLELNREPAEREVLERTGALMAKNAPGLGYDDAAMLQPGDVVRPVGATETSPPARPPSDQPPRDDSATPRRPDPAVADTQPRAEHPDPAPQPTPATPTPPETTDRHENAQPATTATTQPAEASTTAPTPTGEASATPIGSITAAKGDRTTLSALLMAGMSALAAAGVAAALRHRRARAAQATRPHQRPADVADSTRAATNQLLHRDLSDVTWMATELRWLAHRLPQHARAALIVQLVQLLPDRTLEVAFTAPPGTPPPTGWTAVADRVWRLEGSHDPSELDALSTSPPVLPTLITLGDPDNAQLYLNVEAPPGVNVVGDPQMQLQWVTNAIWEIAGEAIAEHPDVIVVDADIPGLERLPAVRRLDEPAAVAAIIDDSATRTGRSMIDRRVDRWDAWPPTVVVLGPSANDARWSEIAARPDVAVIALDSPVLSAALMIEVVGNSLSIAQWNLTVQASVLSAEAVDVVTDLFDETDQPAVPDLEVQIPSPTDTTPMTATVDDSEWAPPTWPVMVQLLGEPLVVRDGTPLELTQQLTSTLAFLAFKRDVAVYDLREAMWGDAPVPDHRVRDLLSRLRKAVGGTHVVSKVDDGRVRAGPHLGSDIAVFRALSERAQQAPAELTARLHQMVNLIRGRPFASAGSATQHWRWVDIDQLEARWMHRTSTAAWELAKLYLDHGDPSTARDIAEQGLRADALSSELTEVLMEAYAGLNAVEAAQQVYVAHDRAVAHLGGASEQTRRVLDRILAATQAEATLDSAVGS